MRAAQAEQAAGVAAVAALEQRLREALAALPTASPLAAAAGADAAVVTTDGDAVTKADGGSAGGGGSGSERSDEAQTQEQAYDRMQAVLAAANPEAQPLADPRDAGAADGNCLTPSRPGVCFFRAARPVLGGQEPTDP